MIRTRASRLLVCTLAVFVGASTASAEPAFMAHLFPPELVMKHQREIALEPEQRRAITEAIQRTQAAVLEIQWEAQEAERTLNELVAADPIDEEAALAQAGQLMGLEVRIKKAHMTLLLRIRGVLRPEQRRTLAGLR